jgi:mRNA interferase RelE/StbE
LKGRGSWLSYKIIETPEFSKCLRKLDSSDLKFIQNKLKGNVYPSLHQNPEFGISIKKLRGYNPQIWRYRVGNYRIFYTLDLKNRSVFLVSIDKRKYAYKRR